MPDRGYRARTRAAWPAAAGSSTRRPRRVAARPAPAPGYWSFPSWVDRDPGLPDSGEPCLGRHARPPFRLHFVEPKLTVLGDKPARRLNRSCFAVTGRGVRAPYLDALAARDHPCARSRISGPHQTRQLVGRTARVDLE